MQLWQPGFRGTTCMEVIFYIRMVWCYRIWLQLQLERGAWRHFSGCIIRRGITGELTLMVICCGTDPTTCGERMGYCCRPTPRVPLARMWQIIWELAAGRRWN